MTDTDTGQSSLTTGRSYGWFTRVWAGAFLFHLAGNSFDIQQLTVGGLIELAMAALAVSLILRPSRGRLALMAALHLPVVALKAPVVGNHEYFELFVHLLILASIGARGAEWRTAFVPAARLTLLVGYGFIAFSKLNGDFFDPDVSCAVLFGNEVGRYVGVMVGEHRLLAHLVIWGTVAAEVAIPLLLVFRWRYAVPFALGFHYLLALDPIGHVYDFSSTLFPLFLLFLPPDLEDFARRWLRRFDGRRAKRMLGLALVAEALILATDRRTWLVAWPAWLLLGGLAGWLAFSYCRKVRPDRLRLFGPIHPAVGVVVALVALNGLAPYLELKTATAFNMYSNLRTADGETNHLVVRRTLPLRSGQDHLLAIVETDDPGLERYRRQELRIPAPSLLTYLAANPDASAVVAFDGRTVAVPSEEATDLFGAAPPWPIEAFAHFRAVDVDGPKSCLRTWEAAH